MIEPRSSTSQADSLPAESQRKPKNTGVGSLSLLQGIFPTQELNWGLLHCRQIFYQLSYQRNILNGTTLHKLQKLFCFSSIVDEFLPSFILDSKIREDYANSFPISLLLNIH